MCEAAARPAYDEDAPTDELRALAIAGVTKEVKKLHETPEQRAAKALKAKTPTEMKDMLEETGVAFDEGASAKELRKLIVEHGVIAKWAALPDTVKLRRNMARAEQSVAQMAAREAHEKAWAQHKEDHAPIEDNPMMNRKKKHSWEIEWDKYDEQEALERLKRLPMWDTLSPEMLNNLMDSIRQDKSMLDMLEGESSMTNTMKDLHDSGTELTLDIARAMGGKLHVFDKNK